MACNTTSALLCPTSSAILAIVSALATIVSLFCSKTESFCRKPSVVARTSSASRASSGIRSWHRRCDTSCRSTPVSSARLQSTRRQSCRTRSWRSSTQRCRCSSRSSFSRSSAVTAEPRATSCPCESFSSFCRTARRRLSYSTTFMVASPHWCCTRAAWNWLKCARQAKTPMIATARSVDFLPLSRSSLLSTPRSVLCSQTSPRFLASVQSRRSRRAPAALSSSWSS
mmetsp:Transcript_94970/g.245306  ORF Transcript_94970/g.245306 Transcript_94970/m.245306 type:complete len:227 (+) Transcript_94970:1544-2224(+)